MWYSASYTYPTKFQPMMIWSLIHRQYLQLIWIPYRIMSIVYRSYVSGLLQRHLHARCTMLVNLCKQLTNKKQRVTWTSVSAAICGIIHVYKIVLTVMVFFRKSYCKMQIVKKLVWDIDCEEISKTIWLTAMASEKKNQLNGSYIILHSTLATGTTRDIECH